MKDVIALPQFVLEDGTVFFPDAYNDGYRTLWRPYAGYFILYQRLAAWGLSASPPQTAPFLYMVFALFVVFYLFALIFSADLPQTKKYLYGAVVLLLPFEGTELATLVNSQWVWALVLLFILAARAESSISAAGVFILFIFGALSGPFVLLLLPLAIAGAYLTRTSRSRIFALIAALASAVHLTAASPLLEPRVGGSLALGNPFWPAALEMLFGYPFYVFTAYVPSLPFHGTIAALLLLLWGLLLALAVRKREVTATMFLAAGFIFALASIAAYRLDPEFLIYRDRYALVPTAAFGWAVVALLPERGRSVLVFLLLPLLFSGFARFFSPALADLEWVRRSECLGGTAPCVIPLHWEGRYILYHPSAAPGPAGRPGRIENMSDPRGAELYRQQENSPRP